MEIFDQIDLCLIQLSFTAFLNDHINLTAAFKAVIDISVSVPHTMRKKPFPDIYRLPDIDLVIMHRVKDQFFIIDQDHIAARKIFFTFFPGVKEILNLHIIFFSDPVRNPLWQRPKRSIKKNDQDQQGSDHPDHIKSVWSFCCKVLSYIHTGIIRSTLSLLSDLQNIHCNIIPIHTIFDRFSRISTDKSRKDFIAFRQFKKRQCLFILSQFI